MNTEITFKKLNDKREEFQGKKLIPGFDFDRDIMNCCGKDLENLRQRLIEKIGVDFTKWHDHKLVAVNTAESSYYTHIINHNNQLYAILPITNS